MSDLEFGIPQDLVELVDLRGVELVDSSTSTTGHGTTASSTSTSSITASSSIKAASTTSTTTSTPETEDLSCDHLTVSWSRSRRERTSLREEDRA